MDSAANERRQAFSVWLRTGRLPAARTADGIELKFNPWHDWATGRFTFAGGGRNTGGWMGGGFNGGGSGGFGGAGAARTWDQPDKRPKVQASRPTAPQLSRGIRPPGPSNAKAPGIIRTPPAVHTLHRAATPSVQRGDRGKISVLAPERSVEALPTRQLVRNGYEYRIDDRQRTMRVSGTLTLSVTPLRSRATQASAGGANRRATDEGGHYIAARFNGPTDAFNHFAQDRNFNRGGYKSLENRWAAATRDGRRVSVRITPSYDGTSKRPASIMVRYSIDGLEENRKFPNERQEKPRGK